MTLTTATAQGQSVKLYLISYRELLPVLSVEEDLPKNGSTEYQVYFKDRQGQVIADGDFYSRFSWEWAAPGGAGSPGNEGSALGGATVKGGVLAGEIKALRSGSYELAGVLSDQLGAYPFDARVRSVNTPPSGSLPELSLPRLGGGVTYALDDYFQDGDGDSLTYSIEAGEEGRAGAGLEGNVLELTPLRSGRQTFTLFVSDGEDTFSYPMEVSVTPIWVTYWWVILLAAAGAGFGLFKLLYKPKPQLEVIAQRKQGNRFAGKMDAYVTVQPPGSGEIPPLTFPMYKIRDSRVCLGDLMREYRELCLRYEVSPSLIEFVLTETILFENRKGVRACIDEMHALGFQCSLDDFGAGFSSLGLLNDLDVDTIKLDRSLVNDLPDNEISRMLVENIVTICKNFGMRCVAESVVTRLQEAALLKAGCIYAQGYYYSKPLPPGKFEKEFLQKGN